MKSFFISIAAVLLIILPTRSFGALYPLTAVTTGSSILLTITGLPNDGAEYELYNNNVAVGPNNNVSTGNWKQKALDGKITWELKGVNAVSGTTYYFTVKKLPSSYSFQTPGAGPMTVTDVVQVQFGTTTTVDIVKDFAITPKTERQVVVTGRVDTTLYQNVGGLMIVFSWSTSPITETNTPSDTKTEKSGVGGQAAIADNGSYALTISNLSPETTYYFRQTVQTTEGTNSIDTKRDTFNTDKGFVAKGSIGEALLFNSKSYHLLAPWPGLSVLMDPDLCLQKKQAKEIPENAICDVNGFLDFAFKMLIGIAAVVLVLRLMFEGYQYLVTDVPFLKASAKGNFFSALLGLLLALSAYVILNTINPKLVDNKINIDSVAVGVDDETEVAPANEYAIGGDMKSCPEGFVDVATHGTPNKINVCKSLATNLIAMINAAKTSNIILTGYGSRSTARQKQLRADHGCPNDSTPASSCHPPTARPGHSMHERGMAIDFSCNGSPIGQNRNNPCYVWLSNNAAKYGFKNLKSEAWHWSVNGR